MPHTKTALHPVVTDQPAIQRRARTDPEPTQPAPVTPVTENDRAFCVRMAQRNGEITGTTARRAADLGMSLRTYERRVASAKAKGLIEVRPDTYRLPNGTVRRTDRTEVRLTDRGYGTVSFPQRTDAATETAIYGGNIYLDTSQREIEKRLRPPSKTTVVPSSGPPSGITQPEGSGEVQPENPSVSFRASSFDPAGTHPAYASDRGPVREVWSVVGDVAAEAWRSRSGRRWTSRDHRMFKTTYFGNVDLPAFIGWMHDHWAEISRCFPWMTDNPPPASPTTRFVCAGTVSPDLLEMFAEHQNDPRALGRRVDAATRQRDGQERRRHEVDKKAAHEAWRRGPHAEEIKRLIRQGKSKRAKELMRVPRPPGEEWRDGPHAREIKDLLISGKSKRARELMAECETADDMTQQERKAV